jgi:Ca2+-binding RTX toxin-like protein
LIGSDAADSITGGTGNDSITGGSGNDTITGDAGADALFGFAGADVIIGGAGNDRINGGADADTLTGGAGVDTFVYTAFAQGGNVVAGNAITAVTAGDIITDFATTVDFIDISVVASGINAALDGAGNGEIFDTDAAGASEGVGVITVDFDFSAAATTGDIIDALIAGYDGGVSIDAGDIAYFAIIDEGGAGTADDFYNIFAVQNTSGCALVNAALKAATVNVTLVGSTAAGDVVIAADFIV